MSKKKISEIRKKVLPTLKSYGVTQAGLFGSTARGDTHAKSDIDLLVKIKKDISLLDFVALKLKLEEALKSPVDLVEYESIKPLLRKYILKDYAPLI